MNIKKCIAAKDILGQLIDKKLPILIAYKISKFVSAVEVEQNFYDEKFLKILNEFGKKDENGEFVKTENGIAVQEEKLGECAKALDELDNLEVDVEPFQLSLSILESIDGLELTPKDLYNLSPFIVEE